MSDAPFLLPSDLKANYLAHKDAVDSAAMRVLESGWYIGGSEVDTFEAAFAEFLGVCQAIGVASGTDALTLALRTCGIGSGDIVLTVSHTAVATVAAVELAGAAPALVDIDEETYTMSPACLERALSALAADPDTRGRVKAIIPVHIYGQPAELDAILDLARAYECRVIEDCAQAHGALYRDRAVGAWGDLGTFSFYPTKNLGALGDAGAVVTDDCDLARRARLLKEYGWEERYVSSFAGMNTRLDPIQAAILGAKLGALHEENARRRQIAACYTAAFADSGLMLPVCRDNVTHVYHQYVVRHPDRDSLRDWLKANGIGSLIHYPVPVHRQPAYEGRLALPAGDLAVTERICGEILSLPMHPQLTDSDVERVINAVLTWLSR
jgi:dTDP-4-amino-4,6-dideoxygalactose transaminase